MFGAQWKKSQVLSGPLLPLDQQQALAREREEVLLLRLPVVEAVRLTRLEHAQLDSELREPGLRPGPFERALRAERLIPRPSGVASVHHEPAFADGHESRLRLLEPRLLDHSSLLLSGAREVSALGYCCDCGSCTFASS